SGRGRTWRQHARWEANALLMAEATGGDLDRFIDLSNGRRTCLKRVDREGDPLDGSPARESKIKLHYTMRVLGGPEIDSSREKGKPFEFYLGRWPSEAMHGWDKAVATMHKGERATVVCGPQYAFGSKGAPPKIPPNATIECELELLGWVDFAVKYNAVPPGSGAGVGGRESESERVDRWKREMADGTSPMRPEIGIDERVQSELEQKRSAGGGASGNTERYVDLNSPEGKAILAKQSVQAYTDKFGYIERSTHLDLYIPVPKGTRAKDVRFEIHPDRMRLSVEGFGVVTEGKLFGRVSLDGCYWFITDLSLDMPGPPQREGGRGGAGVRRGPVSKGETCVQVFLEKTSRHGTMWESFYEHQGD
ncbi:unnamed protein product, partial [Discosporangium mesarthrocarpum]